MLRAAWLGAALAAAGAADDDQAPPLGNSGDDGNGAAPVVRSCDPLADPPEMCRRS